MKDSPQPEEFVLVRLEQLRVEVRAAVEDALAARERPANQEPPADWLDAKGAAVLLGVHARTVGNLAKSGRLRSSRVGRLLRFRRADVLALLERGSG